MESKKMNIVYKKVKDLIPYENNPRNNDEAVDYVANSIKEFGFKVPCVVSGDGVLITVGRLAEYKYYDMEDTIKSALKAVEELCEKQ